MKSALTSFLSLPEEELKLLPKSWQVLGSIVVVKIPRELEHRKKEIGEAFLKLYPRCKTVLNDKGVRGQLREPDIEIIIGSKTETIHIENKCKFKLDAAKLIFSPGNLTERLRMSKLGRGEVVVDMFAGIGYFSIPMAVHSQPKKIYAIELNPVAFHYLKQNIVLNKVEAIVEPIFGNCLEVTPKNIADRVIMGYVHETHVYLKAAIEALNKKGIIHYHEAVPEVLMKTRPRERIKQAAEALGKKAEFIEQRKIKKYSPGVWHVVVDAFIY
ncbi:MAG: class I SAM-dependent methyltransferase family protein [Methanocellales archaeon]